MNVKAGKCLQQGVIALALVLLTGRGAAAQQALAPRDSMAIALQVEVLKHRIVITGCLYRAGKFRIPLAGASGADSLMPVYMAEYRDLYSRIPESMLPGYFNDAFYQETIPAIQYSRNPYWAGLLLRHREQLHPAPPLPDLKHHDEAEKDHVHIHQSR